MPIELQKVLGQELKCFCSKTTALLSEWNMPQLWMWISCIFIALEVYFIETRIQRVTGGKVIILGCHSIYHS